MIETMRVALGGLAANKLRTGLTVLGLMIGVGSVIVLIAVGTGSSTAVENDIDSLGSNLLTVTSSTGLGGLGFFGGGSSSSSSGGLTLADADALENHFQAPDVKSVSPVADASDVTLTYGTSTFEPDTFVGTNYAYDTASDYKLAEGAWITKADVSDHSRVLVIGPEVDQELFSGADPVGDTVAVNGTNFEVIGVTASKGSNGTTDEDDVAFAPLTAVQDTLTGYGSLSEILVQAKSADATTAAQTEVTDVLNTVDPVSAGSDETSNFTVSNQSTVLAASTSSDKVFTTLLAEVAAISLLVGGIGVMNIMLVSVTERTREIGIRKAIGARRSDILTQFLVEAVMVSVLGGVFGIIAGLVGSQFKIAGVEPVIAPYSIFLAFGAAVLTGLFFGTYPASRAARMRPIEALRFE
jgi:putative ABC transport system permease protein